MNKKDNQRDGGNENAWNIDLNIKNIRHDLYKQELNKRKSLFIYFNAQFYYAFSHFGSISHHV